MTNLIKQLQNRGLISQITKKKKLVNKLSKKPIFLYCGFDPTKDSLHLGHLIPLLCLKRFQLAGHTPIALIGGATGLIGDPSFKDSDRNLNNNNIINFYVEKIKKQISRFINFNCGKNSAIITNNYEWFSKMNLLTFLRDIGNNFSVNKMIKKDAIKNRFNSINNGISFKEFSYHIMQSYDFAFLNKKYNVLLQIGGSDQWGNITSGIDLTRRMYKKNVFGLTMPLLKKSDGIKFGKTENNTLWLDPIKTSPYKFYQFWINTDDNDVYRFLKFFTFIDSITVDNIEKLYKNKKKEKKAQLLLADEVTRIVHGENGLISAKRITSSIFGGNLNKLTVKDFYQLEKDGIPKIKIDTLINLQQVLVKSKLAKSFNQARNLILDNAITINSKKEKNPNYIFNNSDILYNSYTLIRRGKKIFCLICWK